MRLSHAILPYRTTPTSANMKGWSETAAKPGNSLVLICSALVCCAGWHRFTILVSSFCSSSFHTTPHQQLGTGHLQRPSAHRQGRTSQRLPAAGSAITTAGPAEQGCGTASGQCPAGHTAAWAGVVPMSRLTFILTYSFCKNPVSPIQQLVF